MHWPMTLPVATSSVANSVVTPWRLWVEVCGAALLHRQARLGSVQRLDLVLLVQRQHQRSLRRSEVEVHHVPNLGGEVRVARERSRTNRSNSSRSAAAIVIASILLIGADSHARAFLEINRQRQNTSDWKVALRAAGVRLADPTIPSAAIGMSRQSLEPYP
jgi:hypothetical protein